MDIAKTRKNIRGSGAKTRGGFSIIEMIVSTSIFIIVMLIVVGAMISLDNANRKARAIRIAMDNISAATDSMSRNIRMGSYYHCGCGGLTDPTFPDQPQDCPMTDNVGAGGNACIAFESQQGEQLVYQLNAGRIERSRLGGQAGSFVPLTAPEIKISDLRFYVSGSTVDSQQPVITMLIRGQTQLNAKTITDFNIETSIGSRTPNYSSAP